VYRRVIVLQVHGGFEMGRMHVSALMGFLEDGQRFFLAAVASSVGQVFHKEVSPSKTPGTARGRPREKTYVFFSTRM
jgi:hypothetical protein